MSAAFRSHGRGTLVLKGTFGGIYLERASGTHDPARLADLKAMCRTLADAGRLDILEQLAQPRGLRPLAVWKHYRGGDWSRLPTPEHVRPFAETFEAWRATVPGARHRVDLAFAGKQLGAVAPKAAIAALPAMVARLRERYAAKGASRTFNKLRDAASAFLKQTLTRQHPLYLAVRAIEPLTVVPRPRVGPRTPAEAWVIGQLLGGLEGAAWWAMCCTGMGPKEFWTDGFVLEDGHLRVKGRKRRARHRLVPLILDELEAPRCTRAAFVSRLKRAGLGVTPYVARRSFARWLEEAGILETHQQCYLGHGPKTISDLYRRPTIVVEILDADQARLSSFVVSQLVGKAVGSDPTPTAQVLMTRAGIEPAAYGLKVSTPNPAIRPSNHPDNNLASDASTDKGPKTPDDTP